MPVLMSRGEWGARPPRSVVRIATPTAKLILHHGASPGEGPSKVRAYQRYHMDARGYSDIAYSWLADRTYAYVGRGPGVQGAHTAGHNSTAHAVCAVGDFSAIDPADALLDNLAWLAVHAWQVGAVTDPAYDGGHRDYGTSSCPGDRLYARIAEINRRAAVMAGGGTTSEEDDMLQQGDRGPHVSALQYRLANWYGIDCTVDGIYGPGTASALKKWERSVGLPDDGVFSHFDLVLFGAEHDARRQRELDQRLDRLEAQ